MGICYCRKKEETQGKKSIEEELIEIYEKSLGLDSHAITQVIKCLFLITVKAEVSYGRMKHFLSTLKLLYNGFDNLQTPLGRFYYKFRESKGLSPVKLGLLAVQLCGGEDTHKVDAIFHCADQAHNQYLSDKELFTLLTDICYIAIEYIPTFAMDSLVTDNRRESALVVKKYMQKLRLAIVDVVEELQAEILQGQAGVSNQDLRNRVANHELLMLCNGRRLREYALKRTRNEELETTRVG